MIEYFQHIGRSLIGLGILIAAIGAVFLIWGKLSWPGRIPGDILIQKKNFTFYFPIATSILISIILSLIFRLWSKR
ncbi:MAG: DUF2905 domain-containing protein [Nitrospirae bacterium]|nr:DUF2905 domain-containing protein [Nitrospirota bacterium]